MNNTNYNAALALSLSIHGEQIRKGTERCQKAATPYVSHLVAVSELVLRYGGDEEQAVAALLHDAVEDGGPQWEAVIGERFGERVRRIVMDCTDGVPDALGEKGEWKPRKERYLMHLAAVGEDALLVSAADKLHNLTCIRLDFDELGSVVFDRFTATADETMWYYGALIAAFEARAVDARLLTRLRTEYAALRRIDRTSDQ